MKYSIIILTIIILFLVSCTSTVKQPKTVDDLILDNPVDECARVDGRWITFGNTCVDSCSKARSPEPVMCGQAFTDGCDCGPERCWNGKTCENN